MFNHFVDPEAKYIHTISNQLRNQAYCPRDACVSISLSLKRLISRIASNTLPPSTSQTLYHDLIYLFQKNNFDFFWTNNHLCSTRQVREAKQLGITCINLFISTLVTPPSIKEYDGYHPNLLRQSAADGHMAKILVKCAVRRYAEMILYEKFLQKDNPFFLIRDCSSRLSTLHCQYFALSYIDSNEEGEFYKHFLLVHKAGKWIINEPVVIEFTTLLGAIYTLIPFNAKKVSRD